VIKYVRKLVKNDLQTRFHAEKSIDMKCQVWRIGHIPFLSNQACFSKYKNRKYWGVVNYMLKIRTNSEKNKTLGTNGLVQIVRKSLVSRPSGWAQGTRTANSSIRSLTFYDIKLMGFIVSSRMGVAVHHACCLVAERGAQHRTSSQPQPAQTSLSTTSIGATSARRPNDVSRVHLYVTR